MLLLYFVSSVLDHREKLHQNAAFSGYTIVWKNQELSIVSLICVLINMFWSPDFFLSQANLFLKNCVAL